MNKAMFGYFDDNGEIPAYDPGFEVDCPICHQRLSEPMKSPSLMVPGDNRSYFYRTHKACYENADPVLITEIDSIIIDAIYAARNVN